METLQTILLPDAELHFATHFFSREESDAYYQELLKTTEWKQEHIHLYGKELAMPRLTAWYGDEGKAYRYSGRTFEPTPWTPVLQRLKAAIEPVCGITFNSVLLNQYRTGQDSVSWHADNEPELGINPVIASLSFGDTRTFQLKHRKDRKQKHLIELTHGSLLVMRGPTQHHWLHQIPKTSVEKGPRINLTFRVIG